MQNRWVRRVGMITLIAALLLAGYGLGVTPAAAAPPVKEDPFAGVTQNWDQNLPSASRFTVLSAFGGMAVRDNNTGLVWDQFPDTNDHTWASAIDFCINKKDRGPVGWRLPSVVELKSVQDLTLLPPFVPPSVFTNVQPAFYWSATTTAANPANAWFVDFGSAGAVRNITKDDVFIAWCVRGPMNADAY